MDEYNQGMDPEVKRYFRKIISSLSYGLIWLLGTVTAGIFFSLGEVRNGLSWYNWLFYAAAVLGFLFLLRYLYRSWSVKK